MHHHFFFPFPDLNVRFDFCVEALKTVLDSSVSVPNLIQSAVLKVRSVLREETLQKSLIFLQWWKKLLVREEAGKKAWVEYGLKATFTKS